jgi:hypothetical protein
MHRMTMFTSELAERDPPPARRPSGADDACRLAHPTTSLRRSWAPAFLLIAAVVHGALTPTHFDEGPVYGIAFITMTVLQVVVAIALLRCPGATTAHWARSSLVVLIALYLFVRVVPVPGDSEPEEASLIGAFTVVVEVAALVALRFIPHVRPPRLRPLPLGVLAGCASAIALLLVTSSLRFIPQGLSREFDGSPPVLLWQDDGIAVDSPRLTLYLTNHLVVFGSVLTLTLIAVLAAEIGMGATQSRAALLAGRPERRHWFWVPAFLAAPVCCGAPLFGIVGPAVFAALLEWGWVPLTIAVSLGGLALAQPAHALNAEQRGTETVHAVQ